ncbi:hypothetical protein HPB49_019083 [Dermacentor silvarum]|uniref:Uncharacterized protein n=1 Tax=Dermacentor silvarum TaxID=543639 RepID=A0ACB8CGV5_DERSI|nr:hypothetical protein HPB49_019083 [Dermacentor silvarum]
MRLHRRVTMSSGSAQRGEKDVKVNINKPSWMLFRRLAKQLGETLGESLSVRSLIMNCAVGNVAHFFFPSGLPDEDAVWQQFTEHLEIIGATMLKAPLFESTPRVFSSLTPILTSDFDSREQIEKYRPRSMEDSKRDFIAQYTEKIEQAKGEPDPTLQYRYLVGNVKDIIMAGSFSTTTTMYWHFLNFAVNRDTIQARVQQEIDEVVGQQREPTWEDRKRMPYTQACLWEMGRWKTGTPLGVAREASDDIVEDDIIIPKGTVIIFNIWAAHNDPTYWTEPHRFDPGRFLNEDGSILQEIPRHLIPFSVGWRRIVVARHARGSEEPSAVVESDVDLASGASTGIGEGTALRFASLGCWLSLTARNRLALEEVAEKCRAKGVPTEKVGVTTC